MDGVSRDHKRDKEFKSKEKSEVESWRGNQFRKSPCIMEKPV